MSNMTNSQYCLIHLRLPSQPEPVNWLMFDAVPPDSGPITLKSCRTSRGLYAATFDGFGPRPYTVTTHLTNNRTRNYQHFTMREAYRDCEEQYQKNLAEIRKDREAATT